MSERFQVIGGVMRDTQWVCHILPPLPPLPKYPVVEVRALQAALWGFHRYRPFPECSRFPTTRLT